MATRYREGALRLAVGTRDRLIQVWVVDSTFNMQSVFCVELKTSVPKSINIVDNTARDIRVLGFYDGKLYVFHLPPSKCVVPN